MDRSTWRRGWRGSNSCSGRCFGMVAVGIFALLGLNLGSIRIRVAGNRPDFLASAIDAILSILG